MKAARIAAVRTLHGAISLMFLGCIVYVYRAGLTGRGNPRLTATAVGLLASEAIIIVANDGDCLLGGIHHAAGDDRTFFELFMPRALAARAVPVLGVVAATGIALVAVRAVRERVAQ